MSRSVRVTLEADVGKYIPPVIAAKDETEKLDDKIKDTNRDLDKTPAAAARAAAAMKLLGGDTKGVGQQLNDLGPQATNSLELIEKKLEDARLRVKTFADEFNKTGSADSFNLWQKAVSDVSGLEKMQKSLTSALPQMKALATGAEGAADRFKQFSEATDDAGNKINKAMSFSKFLSAELTRAKNAAEDLGREFKRTGDTDVLGRLINAKAIVKDLEKVSKGVEDAISQGGKEGAKSLTSSLQGALSTPVLGPVTVGAIAAAVVATLPAIGSAIGAAFIGSAGLGLIGLGIAGQIHSPAVVSALDQLKARATDDLTGATSAFGPVLVKGLHGFSDELDKIAPDIQRNINKLAIPASHLFEGIGQFFDKLGPGIDALSSASAPFIDVLAAELPRLASAFSTMFSDISANAPGAITFFHDLFTLIDILIIATGKFASAMEKLYGWLREVADIFGGHPGQTALGLAVLKGAQDDASASAKNLKTNMEVAAASIDIAGGKAMSASDQYGMLISKLKAVNSTADTVAGAMVDKWVGSMLNADLAANNFDKSLVTLGDTLVQNGGHLSDHVKQLKKTETGQQQNKDAILAVVQANLQEYDSQIAAGIAASDAAAKYDENTKALEDQLRAAGWTQAAIDGLIGKYRNVPDKVNTAIAIDGLTSAIDDLNDLIRLINGLHSKTITIAEEHTYTYQDPSQYYHGHGATGGIRTAAAGTLVMPRDPGTLLIGEPQTGGEALIPLRGISQMRAASLGQVAMSGYGLDVVPRGYRAGPMSSSGGTLRVELAFTGGNDALTSLLMKMQRTGDLQLTATRV